MGSVAYCNLVYPRIASLYSLAILSIICTLQVSVVRRWIPGHFKRIMVTLIVKAATVKPLVLKVTALQAGLLVYLQTATEREIRIQGMIANEIFTCLLYGMYQTYQFRTLFV